MSRLKGAAGGRVSKVLLYAGAILVGTAAIAIAAAGVARALGSRTPLPASGSLDLGAWDFASAGPVSLRGSWDFLPDALVSFADFDKAAAGRKVSRTVPDIRRLAPRSALPGSGTGTYRLSILLPASAKGLAIRYSSVWTAFELEVNGVVVARAGRPALDAAASVAAFAPGIVGVGASGGRLDIAVRVSNHEYRWGGIAMPFILGEEEGLVRAKRIEDVWAFLMVGALLGIAANSFFIFAFRRREKAYLFFAWFAAFVALRALVVGDALLSDIFPSIGFDLLVRLEYSSYFLLLPAGVLFFAKLFPEDVSQVEILALVVPSFAFALLLPFASLHTLTWSILPYAFVAGLSIIYGFVIACVRPALRGRPASRIVLFAGIFLLATITANISFSVAVAHVESVFPLGLPLFIIVQTLALAQRFTAAFDKVESLSGELASANARLEGEISLATDSRNRLETAVAEKDRLLQEVHHRVKNSLQIVSSIIKLQTHRTRDAAALEAYRSVSDRIRAISGVHDTLYGLDSEQRVSLGIYAGELIRQFTACHGEGEASIDLSSDDIEIPMDLCLELGLALTELVSNAYRHAIVPLGSGSIRVEIKREIESILLVVADEGPGFPPDFVADSTDSVGFKIVTSLARQRRGSVSLSKGPGAVVSVRIPWGAVEAA